MQIRALRPEFSPHALKERAQLFCQRSAPDRNHLRDEQACKDAVFFGGVAADRHSRTFFSTHRDLVLLDQLADVLEAYRGLKNSRALMPANLTPLVPASPP